MLIYMPMVSSITVASDNWEILIGKLLEDLNCFWKWSVINKLMINIYKTKVLPYFHKNRSNYLNGKSIKLNGESLKVVETNIWDLLWEDEFCSDIII